MPKRVLRENAGEWNWRANHGKAFGSELAEHEMEANYFTSLLGKKFFNTDATQFNVRHFRFKSDSEHTINGKHMDLEV